MALIIPLADFFIFMLSDASFAESLYGLRRRGVKIRLKKSNVLTDAGDEVNHTGLHKRQKVLSVVFLVNNLLNCTIKFELVKESLWFVDIALLTT